MNEQNITILNEKQDRTMKNIMEHIKDRIKCQNIAIRFRNTEKTLLANAIISNKNVKIIITDKALIKEISKNLKDIQNKVWGKTIVF